MKSDKIKIETSCCSAIGGRNYQEDCYVLSSTKNFGWLLAVMDGHSGNETANYCRDHIGEIFLKTKSLIETVKLLNQQTQHFESGSTLSIVHIPKNALTANIAILGDSPVIVKGKNGTISVSPEHNVRTNLAEREAVIKRGGVYQDGYIFDERRNYGLQMSRALGDSALSSILSREADIYSIELGPESFIIVVSDGVIDPAHENSIVPIDRIAKLIENGADAKKIVDDALARKTGDNATAVVWRRTI